MESFYGGKSGFSFIIVKSFSSVAEMVRAFKQGPTYSAVHYDEHVLINTENKNDSDNGKIYRRGYDYTNELGGAVYIGTIVGPAGRAPMLELTTIEQVLLKQATEGFDNRFTDGEYSVPVSLVPGKDGNNYNDVIEWACCCVRSRNGEDSTAYIGFKFPYTVIDFTAESVNPYYHRSNNTADFVNENLTERVDDFSHPFYEKWHFSVPKGITGDSLKHFKLITVPSEFAEKIYGSHEEAIADPTTEYAGKADDVEGINDDATKPRQILVYDYYDYSKNPDGDITRIYLGDYNMIDSIFIDKEEDAGAGTTGDGTFTINYTHKDSDVYEKLFTWIKKVTLNSSTGHFTVEYNNDTIEEDGSGNPSRFYETDLAWVKSITIADDGKITLHYTGGKDDETLQDVHLRWIDDIEIELDGTVIVNYNDGTNDTFDNKLQWITSVSLTGSGVFTVKYNNGTPDYVTSLVWVRDITIADNGTIEILFNNDTKTTYEKMLKYIDRIYFDPNDNKFHVVYNTGDDEPVNNVIKFIDNIYLDEDETDGDFKFHVVYNTDENEEVSEPVNWVADVAIDTDEKKNYHFLVYYKNARVRELLADPVTYHGKDGWLDLGSLKDDSGILVGLNIIPTGTIGSDITAAIAYLNGLYPDGLTDTKNHGKIITIGDTEENKMFYAYDYDTNEWYYLGTFENTTIWTVVKAEADMNDTIRTKMAIGGVWFILEGEDD